MDKGKKVILAVISIILSPLFGGMVGEIILALRIIRFSDIYWDNIYVFFSIISWLVASVIYYLWLKDQ